MFLHPKPVRDKPYQSHIQACSPLVAFISRLLPVTEKFFYIVTPPAFKKN
jgi:hypothetical protein